MARLGLRVPRPKGIFGLVSLETGTELISLALVVNKVTGVYGVVAILTGYHLSLLQLSTYVYSMGVLALLVYLMPHIRRQSPLECLGLAWVYLIDTAVNGAYTAAFGLEWYLASAAADGPDARRPSSLPSLATEGLAGLRRQSAVHGRAAPRETVASVLLIVGLTLIRVYLSLVVVAFARQVLQLGALQVGGDQGPFAADQPDGHGRKGRLGRLMVSVGRRYWLETDGTDEWRHCKPNVGGTLAGEV